ncbi:MAG: hypothetical protein RQ714_05990 [Nitrosomonas sp.]|nr:hypothetical protein [Nitrosomonas sp.]
MRDQIIGGYAIQWADAHTYGVRISPICFVGVCRLGATGILFQRRSKITVFFCAVYFAQA